MMQPGTRFDPQFCSSRRRLRALVVAAACASLPFVWSESVHATNVSQQVRVSIDEVGTQLAAAFAIGDQFSVSFSYDDTVVDTNDSFDPPRGRFDNALLSGSAIIPSPDNSGNWDPSGSLGNPRRILTTDGDSNYVVGGDELQFSIEGASFPAAGIWELDGVVLSFNGPDSLFIDTGANQPLGALLGAPMSRVPWTDLRAEFIFVGPEFPGAAFAFGTVEFVPEPGSIFLASIGVFFMLCFCLPLRIARRSGTRYMAYVAAMVVFATSSNAAYAAVKYEVIDLGTLGGSSSRGVGINESGWVTGRSDTVDDEFTHAFLYDGSMQDLGTLGGTFSRGEDINDVGNVTGWSDVDEDASHAFLYDGVMHDLGTLGGTTSEGHGINDAGFVTGWAEIPGDNAHHAFLYDGIMHDLGTLGGTYSSGAAINSAGVVTGTSDVTGDASYHAFRYDGTMHDLGTLGGDFSEGSSINNAGLVAGASETAEGLNHAFLYDGTMHDLGTLGGSGSIGFGINNLGHVTGLADTTDDFYQHAFLYTSAAGMVNLNSLIDPQSGWELLVGNAINDAGQIAGVGRINGERHAILLNPVGSPGDFDGDGVVSGRDGLVWQRGGSPTPFSAGDLADFQQNFGAGGGESPGPPIPHDPCTGCEGIVFQMVVDPNTNTFKLAVGNFGAGAKGLAGWSLNIWNADSGSLTFLSGVSGALVPPETAPFESGSGTSLMWLQDVNSPLINTSLGIGSFVEFATGTYSNGLPAFAEPAGANVFLSNSGFSASEGMIGGFRTTVLPLTGDYNGDGMIDAADYTVWRDTLGQQVIIGQQADGNHNGTIDEGDYLVWKQNFGASNGSSSLTAVPEPTNAALVSLFATFLVAWRRALLGRVLRRP